jgi:GTP-binding protein LepA
MDTPGHVDFAYEVCRSLAACEGALLVVDAAQGVEAQTLANVYQSIEHDHEIVPSSTRSTSPPPSPKRSATRSRRSSASTPRRGAHQRQVGHRHRRGARRDRRPHPAPKGDRDAPLKAMLVDSWYDPYLGVVILVRVIDGVITKGQQIKFMAAAPSI